MCSPSIVTVLLNMLTHGSQVLPLYGASCIAYLMFLFCLLAVYFNPDYFFRYAVLLMCSTNRSANVFSLSENFDFIFYRS